MTRHELTNFEKVREFHHTYGHPVADRPALVGAVLADFRDALIEEELDELRRGIYTDDLVEIADALGDLLYVIYGTALVYGIPIDKVFDAIHTSNMSKTPNGQLKPIKGPDFIEAGPMIVDILNGAYPQ